MLLWACCHSIWWTDSGSNTTTQTDTGPSWSTRSSCLCQVSWYTHLQLELDVLQWISLSVNTCTMYTINEIYIKGKFQDTQHCLRNTMNFIILSLSLSLCRCFCADCGSDVPDVCQRSDLDAPPLAQLPVLVLWILCPVRILCCILWNLSVFEINRDPSQARQSNHGNREETRASPPSNRNGTTHETPSLWT